MAYKAGGIGAGRNEVMEIFEKDYKSGMTRSQATTLGLRALAAASENKLKSEVIEIAVVSAKEEFHTLAQDAVKKAVAKVK